MLASIHPATLNSNNDRLRTCVARFIKSRIEWCGGAPVDMKVLLHQECTERQCECRSSCSFTVHQFIKEFEKEYKAVCSTLSKAAKEAEIKAALEAELGGPVQQQMWVAAAAGGKKKIKNAVFGGVLTMQADAATLLSLLQDPMLSIALLDPAAAEAAQVVAAAVTRAKAEAAAKSTIVRAYRAHKRCAREKAALCLQTRARGNAARRDIIAIRFSRAEAARVARDTAAVRLQKFVRGLFARSQLSQLKAAAQLQSLWRGLLGRRAARAAARDRHLKTAFEPAHADERLAQRVRQFELKRGLNALAAPQKLHVAELNWRKQVHAAPTPAPLQPPPRSVAPGALIAVPTPATRRATMPTACAVDNYKPPETIYRSLGMRKVKLPMEVNGTSLRTDGNWYDRNGTLVLSPLLVGGTQQWNVAGTGFQLRVAQRFRELPIESPEEAPTPMSDDEQFAIDVSFVRSCFTNDEIPAGTSPMSILHQAARVMTKDLGVDISDPFAGIVAEKIRTWIGVKALAAPVEPVFQTPAPKK